MEFNSEGRIVWVEIEGIPFKLWSGNTFKRIASKWEELLHIDDQEDKCFHSKRICIYTKFEKNIFEAFKIIFRGKESEDEDESDDGSKEGDSKVHDMGIYGGDSDVEEVLETLFEERGQSNNKLDEASMSQQENHSEDLFKILMVKTRMEAMWKRRRFDKPNASRACVDMSYPKTVSFDQQVELELDVSKEEIKRAVDFEKAYDSVRWDFLDDVLKKFGFGDKWCNWTQSCLRSSRGSIIINGSPTEEFQFYKGLKQGDPLSPFLFILVMESLHLSFQRVVDAGMYKGIKLSPSLNLSHMFYTDNAVFVGQWCDGNIKTLVHFRVQAWNEVVDRVKAWLSNWKMKALSIGGRLTLLKSILGSMPIFHMSIFRVPLSVLRMLESIRSHFFNGHELKSLMYKWVWRFYTQFTSLWARVIKAIHGDDMKVGTYAKAGIQSRWMNIVHEINSLKKQGINLLDCIHVKLGNGEKIAFWEDIWVEDNALKNLYPRMYALETCKSVTVGTKLAHSSLESSFCCKPRGGVEQEQYDALSGQVHDVTFVPMSDRWIWSLESSGDFSVASVRKVIDNKLLPDVGTKTRWIKSVPIKVNDHAWKVKIDSLPTRFNISRRGIDIESIMCSICDNGAKSTSHLIFTCHMVRDIIR
ncbi:RNA-directed DNA polymerase, eukaryota, reverse transcriptase zinc-binding domain protein [Tanacetum coccineum]